MENQTTGPLPAAMLPTLGTLPSTGDWPAVPPAPCPVKPTVTVTTPEPPILTGLPVLTALPPRVVDDSLEPVTAIPAVGVAPGSGDAPTLTIPPGRLPLGGARGVAVAPGVSGVSPADVAWHPRFAQISAAVIFGAITLVALPLWIVLYRLIGTVATTPDGPQVADLMALCMMLTGGYLTGAALWLILVEMRGRVRMVGTLARTGEREAATLAEPVAWDATQPVEAGQTPSGHLFGGVPRSYGQLPAQVAILAIALALFISATILSAS